ncbi:G-protein coupled receptor 157 [Sphaerodactylus townsendi]|uniref:G-protein coupled receptor 157 n=1 Tax=Sphaerodactylus townsendi TaxID=933632 RepID=UPI0020273A6A|nr:G-protein coupled receptor 157 [Sphaerodactylus townsendi]
MPPPGGRLPLLATPVSPWERAAVLGSCALSAAGSGLLVATHARWPELRTRPRQLLLWLSLADLLSAAAYFYGALRAFRGPSWDCVAQGALSSFANTSAFFWTVAVALELYLAIVRGAPARPALLALFHALSWGVPLVITAVAVALKKIGYDASDVSVGWCWIDIEAKDRVLWMLLAGKLWEILAYFTLPVFYILIRKHINRAHAALSEYRPILSRTTAFQPRTSVADKKLILIPLIFILLRIWSTVRFVLTLCDSPAVQNPVLVVLHGIGNTFQGGANCIMFVFCTRVVRNKLFSCLCCQRYDSQDPSLPSPENGHQNHVTFPKDWESQDSKWDTAEFSST